MSEEQRMVILRAYWGLGEPRMRWDDIAKTVKVVAPKFRHTGTKRTEESSRIYTINIGDQEVTVCKKFYTLSIAETIVITALSKKS